MISKKEIQAVLNSSPYEFNIIENRNGFFISSKVYEKDFPYLVLESRENKNHIFLKIPGKEIHDLTDIHEYSGFIESLGNIAYMLDAY